MSFGWTNSADGGPGRRSTLGGGSCTTPLMAWSGGTSPGRAGEAFSFGSFCPSLYNDRIFGEFLLLLARAVHTWKYGTLFPPGFVSGSYLSCVWVLHEEHCF